MKRRLKKLANRIMVRICWHVPYPEVYEYAEKKIDFWNIISFQIKKTSEIE